MNRWVWMACWIATGAAALSVRAQIQDRPENPYYVDGLLIDQYRQADPGSGVDSSVRRGSVSLQEPPPPVPLAPPSSLRRTPGAAEPLAGRALEHLRSADAWAEKREWGKALDEIQKGLEADPSSLLLMRRGSAIAALAGNYSMADDFYRRLLRVQPDDVSFLTGRAAVQIRLRQYASAQTLNDRALLLAPGELLARFNRALLQVIRGEAVESESWRDLLTSDVAQVANWLDADKSVYIEILSPAKYDEVCEAILGPGLSTKLPDVLALLNRLHQAQRLQQWDKASSVLQEARVMGLKAMGLEMDHAQVLVEQGQQDEALGIMKSLSERFPSNQQVLYNTAFILVEKGLYAEALPLLDRAHEMMPDHPQIRFAKACMLAEVGRMEEAWPLLNALIRDFPVETRTWLQEEDTYMEKIKADPRYPGLLATRAPKRR